MSEIIIKEKVYTISCNALTRFHYKKLFGTGIFKDIALLQKINTKSEELRKELKKTLEDEKEIEEKVNESLLEDADTLLDVVEKMAYVLIYTADNGFMSFNNWLESMESIDLKETWVSEVINIISKSFC